MDFDRWEPLYRAILEDFGYDRAEDEAAARLLAELLPEDRVPLAELRDRVRGRPVTVLGNAPSLAEELGGLEGVEGAVVAADEATSVALAHGIVPDAVVTDLDGRAEDLRAAQERGAILVVHAHGDNVAALRRWAPALGRRVVATTQARPFDRVHNFGGFTDGDRAVFLADHLGAGPILLLGFDFDRPNPKDAPAEVKRRKLAWARRLIDDLASRRPVRRPSGASSG